MLNHPLTQYMFCSPDEGAAAVVLCRADRAHRYTDTPIYLRASTVRTRRLGAFEVHSPWLPIEETRGPHGRRVAGGLRDGRDRARRTSTSSSCRTPTPAPRSSTWPRTASAPTATRRRWWPTARSRSAARLPVNTDGGLIANGEPIGASGLRQVHEVVLQLRGRAGDRQVPGSPKVGYTQLYGAPGMAGVSILSV